MPKKQRTEDDFDHDPTVAVNKRKAKRSGASGDDDAPRAFKQIMRYQKFAEDRSKSKTEEKQKQKPAAKPALAIRKGESMWEFSQRVNDAMPLPSTKGKGAESKKSQNIAKKQRTKADNLRKEHSTIKEKRGRQMPSDDEDDEDVKWSQRDRSPDPWAKLEKNKKKAKFGEVADRPPELPTLRRFNNVPKAAGSQARREMLAEERSKVIEAYRKMNNRE